MKKAFTLLELLVVIGIMGLLGTVSVGGYRAMQRGMEERGVEQNVKSLITAAGQRAQIDRQPTAIYFWNETIRSQSEDENEIVVGRAVAVRRNGRISLKTSDLLIDEYADLNLTYPSGDGTDDSSDSGDKGSNNGANSATQKGNTMYLYLLDNQGNANVTFERSIVSSIVEYYEITENYMQLGGNVPTDNTEDQGKIPAYGFKIIDQNGANWKTGSAYGTEFAELTLPHGYIFGSNYSKNTEDPIREAGKMRFKVAQNTGNGISGSISSDSITIYSLRPDGAGGLKASSVATVSY